MNHFLPLGNYYYFDNYFLTYSNYFKIIKKMPTEKSENRNVKNRNYVFHKYLI